MAKIFVTVWRGHLDYSQLDQWGEPTHILKNWTFYPDNMDGITMANSMKIIGNKLKDFDFDTDYIVPSGDPLVILMVGLTLARIADRDSFKMLRWDREEGSYFPVIVPMVNMKGITLDRLVPRSESAPSLLRKGGR